MRQKLDEAKATLAELHDKARGLTVQDLIKSMEKEKRLYKKEVKRQRRQAKKAEREEAKKHAIAHVRQAQHPRGWNRSTQAGRMIHTPFQPLGPGSDNQTPEISEEKVGQRKCVE